MLSLSKLRSIIASWTSLDEVWTRWILLRTVVSLNEIQLPCHNEPTAIRSSSRVTSYKNAWCGLTIRRVDRKCVVEVVISIELDIRYRSWHVLRHYFIVAIHFVLLYRELHVSIRDLPLPWQAVLPDPVPGVWRHQAVSRGRRRVLLR